MEALFGSDVLTEVEVCVTSFLKYRPPLNFRAYKLLQHDYGNYRFPFLGKVSVKPTWRRMATSLARECCALGAVTKAVAM